MTARMKKTVLPQLNGGGNFNNGTIEGKAYESVFHHTILGILCSNSVNGVAVADFFLVSFFNCSSLVV